MTTRNYTSLIIIEKEEVEGLHFPDSDVLKSLEEINRRSSELQRAMLLGNNYKGKVKIVFEDSISIKQVETTVWGFTDKRVILKKELLIPIHRIFEILT